MELELDGGGSNRFLGSLPSSYQRQTPMNSALESLGETPPFRKTAHFSVDAERRELN